MGEGVKRSRAEGGTGKKTDVATVTFQGQPKEEDRKRVASSFKGSQGRRTGSGWHRRKEDPTENRAGHGRYWLLLAVG